MSLLTTARLWLGATLLVHVTAALLPHSVHFSLHFLLEFVGILTAAFMGGTFMQAFLSDATADLLDPIVVKQSKATMAKTQRK